MMRNMLKAAFRNLRRHKGFSIINIAGLTLGLTACIVIGLFVWDENQYDKFLPNADRIFRVYNDYRNNEGQRNMAATPPMFATVLNKDFPEVDKATRVMMLSDYKALFEAGKNKLYEQSGFFVDSNYLEVLPLEFRYGSPANALNDPGSVIISDDLSQRLFGDADPVGKQLLMEKKPLIVKGVFLKNSKFHLQFNYLRPVSGMQIPEARMQSWGWSQFFTYIKVRKETNAASLQAKFQKEVKEKSADLARESIFYTPYFQRIQDIHLYAADFKFDAAQRGNILYVNALLITAIIILLIACFNFINLATAKSLQRAKEVGVRKAIGAAKKQLIFQFIGETTLLAGISIIISVVLAIIILPWLNDFTGKHIPVSIFANPVLICVFIALMVIVGMLAGFYPAIVLSKFNPVKVLKSSVSEAEPPGKIPWLRQGLVVVQFTLSVLLIISATVVYNQVNYLHNKDLGFNKDQIMFFPMRGENMFNNMDAFKNDLIKNAGVKSVSIGYGFPGDAVAGDDIIVPRNGERISQSATQLTVDYDYIKTLGLQIIAGRDFSKDMGTDKDHAWIINETAVQTLGFGTAQKALGQTLYWHPWNTSREDSFKTGQVIGVVKDFNYKSLYDKLETTVLQIYPDAAWKVAVKLQSVNMEQTIAGIQRSWNKFSPEFPLEYKFLDDSFETMYKSEDKLRSLLAIFTGIAIFVGCLGLFGLSAYTSVRRRKEVGIRKVLGASTQSIIILLSKDFVKLVLVSLVIASPVAWYVMNAWLEGFAYRIDISWWMFATAAILATGIALVTVSFQAIRAAIANPVKSLRTE